MKKTLGLLALLALGWYFPLAWPQLGSRTGLDRGSLGRGTGEQLARMLLGISTHNLELFLGLGSYRQWYKPQRNLLKWSEDLTKGVWLYSNVTVTCGQADPWGGNTACRLQPTAASERFNQMDIPVVGGMYYTLMFAGKNNGGNAANLTVYDVSNSSFIIDRDSFFAELSNDSWSIITRVFQVPSTCSSIGVYLTNYSGPGADFFVARPLLVPGKHIASEFSMLYQPTEDFQTVTDFSGKGRDAQNGSTASSDTNDATRTVVGSVIAYDFDGVDDYLSNVYALGSTWTVINCNTEFCLTETSAGDRYHNVQSDATGMAWDITTAGGYSGYLTIRVQYSRVLTQGEARRAVSTIGRRLYANFGFLDKVWLERPYTGQFSMDFGG